ncbi:transcriptional regulator GcvA [Neorhizobium sp. P12A]|uniref:transcriptional regulator GcvA n=1 Tax=Neorhizobium sp. P12A TaxID=2268027 RepID=UPI0011ED5725|nr:transcriptional regulator GcvA [Neorhizobium sp. P12A]KAA0685947.1 transcriptional regulator GcvA [Neorhizobium sp. P12A]
MARHIPGTRSLLVLDAAARHLNFTQAAHELQVTPAAVSHQIKEFEDQLGVELFVRANRSLKLTGAGEIFFDAARTALEGLRQAAGRARRLQAPTRLRVSAPTSIAAKWLLPRLRNFTNLQPQFDVRISISCDQPNFDHDDTDLAILFCDGQGSELTSDRLFDHAIFPVCNPIILHGSGAVHDVDDLLRHTLIHVSWSGQGVTWPDWAMWMEAAGVGDFKAKPGLYFENTALAIQAALEGHGIALGDLSLVADDLDAGRLVRPLPLTIAGPPNFAYFILTPTDTAADPLIASFREWLLAEAKTTQSKSAQLLLAEERYSS